MISEGPVLFRVKHLKQCRGRITTEVHGHFVDLVEQEQRIADTRFAKALDDLAGHRTNVSTTMTAYFGFITHTTQGHTDELTVGCSRNRLA